MPLTNNYLIATDGGTYTAGGQGRQKVKDGVSLSTINQLISNVSNLASISGQSFGSSGSYVLRFSHIDLVNNDLIVYHNLNEKNVIVSVYDDNSLLSFPSEIELLNENTLRINFTNTPIKNTWEVVVVYGGGSNVTTATLIALSGSILSTVASTRFTKTFSSLDLVANKLNITHNMDDTYINVCVYDDNNQLTFPSEITIIDSNNVQLDFTHTPINTGTWKALLISGNAIVDLTEFTHEVTYDVNTTPFDISGAGSASIFIVRNTSNTTINLPPGIKNKKYTVKKLKSDNYTMTINPYGLSLIDESSNYVYTTADRRADTFVFDGTDWIIT